jgi:hypothetical protein
MFSASLIIFMILASNMAEDTSSSHTKIAVLWFLEFAGILTRRKKSNSAGEKKSATYGTARRIRFKTITRTHFKTIPQRSEIWQYYYSRNGRT